jgi:hypothetical protein
MALQHCVVLALFHGNLWLWWFNNGKDFPGWGSSAPRSTLKLEATSFGPYLFTCLAWVALPGAYVPASISLWVIGVCKSPLRNKAMLFGRHICIVTCRGDCRRAFGLDDLDLLTLYIHTTRDYRQYSAIVHLHTLQIIITHALWFSVFTNRVLTTDL